MNNRTTDKLVIIGMGFSIALLIGCVTYLVHSENTHKRLYGVSKQEMCRQKIDGINRARNEVMQTMNGARTMAEALIVSKQLEHLTAEFGRAVEECR